ncbi:MAG: ribosomal-protein-alanine N-acetyltransferase [Planctomycetaceae bacterium]|jgi:ribosomal-protein-alanine N-acetyltransferase
MRCIDTSRLRLRQWCDNDFDNYAAYYADESNAKYIGGPKNPDEAWRTLALQIGHWQLKGFSELHRL